MSAGAPVSLALTNTIPAASALPPSLPLSLLPQPNLPALPGGPGASAGSATTRILNLTGFSPELKTRDIQSIFAEWEDERGGFKIKWVDDTSCLVVFGDAGVAKKAFLSLLASPHPLLTLPTPLSPTGAKLRAHTGPDVTHILTSVQNRPRSRSNAQAHSRKSSMNVQGGTAGHRRDSQGGSGGNAVGSMGSRRQGSMSAGRPSAQQIQERIEEITSSAVLTQETPDGAITTGNATTTPPAVSGSPTSTTGEISFVTAAGSPPKINDAGRRHLNAALGINGKREAEEAIIEAGDEAP